MNTWDDIDPQRCSLDDSHGCVDARETLVINRYCSSLNRPPRPRFAKAPRLTQAGNGSLDLVPQSESKRLVITNTPLRRGEAPKPHLLRSISCETLTGL